jgi:hypothetical protein
LTERCPGESKERLAGGGIVRCEIGDLGEQDADRIAAADVTRFVVRIGTGEGEEDRIPGGEGLAGG